MLMFTRQRGLMTRCLIALWEMSDQMFMGLGFDFEHLQLHRNLSSKAVLNFLVN